MQGTDYNLKNILNYLPFGVMLVNVDGIVQECNMRLEEMLNYKRANIIGKLFLEILNNNEVITEALIQKKSIMNFMFIFNNKKFYLSLTFDQHKNTWIFIQDLNNLKCIKEVELLNLELETIINSSFDEIFVTDGEGKVLRVNPAGESLYGLKAEEIIGRNANKLAEEGLYSPALYPIVKERNERVSMVQRTKVGKIVHVIANPVLNNEGEIELIIFTSRDISEISQLRKKIERTETLLKTYKEELNELNKFQEPLSNIVAYSPNMRKLLNMVNKISSVDSTVLLTGESGVGKGLIASNIHHRSVRKDGPFVELNCGAIPEALIESELFGYEPGAFTGANKEGKKGIIEQANGGTLFLDEIGEMPLNLQVKLLKAIQDRVIQRVGGTKLLGVDIRIVAATNKNLEEMVSKGEFREDLYYRLNVIPIHIPPLRTRPEDISYLIDYFLDKYNKKYNFSTYLSLDAENTLISYEWPGNVRQLENIIERLVVTSDNKEISISDLPENIIKNKKISSENFVKVFDICTLKQAQEELESQ